MTRAPDPAEYGWWLASRASGLVALALITCSVLLGLGMASKAFRRPGLAPKLMAFHEHLALSGLIAIAIHGITLLGDTWLHPGPVGIAVPFVMDYKPVWTGLGIIGGHLAALLGLSFYFRKRIGNKRWRSLHKLTIVVYVLSLAHTIGAGSDVRSPAIALGMLVSAGAVFFLLLLRMLPQRLDRPRPAKEAT